MIRVYLGDCCPCCEGGDRPIPCCEGVFLPDTIHATFVIPGGVCPECAITIPLVWVEVWRCWAGAYVRYDFGGFSGPATMWVMFGRPFQIVPNPGGGNTTTCGIFLSFFDEDVLPYPPEITPGPLLPLSDPLVQCAFALTNGAGACEGNTLVSCEPFVFEAISCTTAPFFACPGSVAYTVLFTL